MFNLSGSEIVFLLLIALIVLGPEKLPEAVRRFGKVYAEIKKMSSGFQSELREALDEPMREMRETAEAIKNAADFNFMADSDIEPDADAASETPAAEPASDAPVEPTSAPPFSPAVNGDASTAAEPTPQPKVVETVDGTTTE